MHNELFTTVVPNNWLRTAARELIAEGVSDESLSVTEDALWGYVTAHVFRYIEGIAGKIMDLDAVAQVEWQQALERARRAA